MSEKITPTEQSVVKTSEQEKIWDDVVDFDGVDEESKKIIETCVRNPDNFLGEGGAGKVYIFETRCIKMIRKIKKFHGNTPDVEFRIQWQARKLNVNGVYAPRPIQLIEGEKCAAIVMERLNAVNMVAVIKSLEALPANFELESFFERLEKYLDELHELGIIHNDIDARNIMIDIETGRPRVIDFGNALDFSRDMPDDFFRQADVDSVALDKTREMMAKYLSAKTNKKTIDKNNNKR